MFVCWWWNQWPTVIHFRYYLDISCLLNNLYCFRAQRRFSHGQSFFSLSWATLHTWHNTTAYCSQVLNIEFWWYISDDSFYEKLMWRVCMLVHITWPKAAYLTPESSSNKSICYHRYTSSWFILSRGPEMICDVMVLRNSRVYKKRKHLSI